MSTSAHARITAARRMRSFAAVWAVLGFASCMLRVDLTHAALWFGYPALFWVLSWPVFWAWLGVSSFTD